MKTGNVAGHNEVIAEANRLSLISWGSVLAGLFFIMAMSWLLYLLGLSIGVSVADATDKGSISSGFGISAMMWIIFSSIIVYFLGGMLTARLSGKHDKKTGMLHGVTLWGVTTTLILVLSYIGIANLLQTGQSLLSSTASTVVNTASALGTGTTKTVDYIARHTSEAANNKIIFIIQAKLKRHAATVIANSEPNGGGAEASSQDALKALEQIDIQVLQSAALQLMQRDIEGAKNVLIANTNLSDTQINSIVEGVNRQIAQTINQYENELRTATEAMAVYSQAVMWAVFSASAIGLALSILGGSLGAATSKRLYFAQSHQTIV